MTATVVRLAMRAARDASEDGLVLLLERAKAQGAVRADAEARDVRILVRGAARVLSEEEEQDPAVWRRCANLIADALRP